MSIAGIAAATAVQGAPDAEIMRRKAAYMGGGYAPPKKDEPGKAAGKTQRHVKTAKNRIKRKKNKRKARKNR